MCSCYIPKILSFFLLLLSLNFSMSSFAWEFSSKKDDSERCAQFYFQPSFLGQSLLLKDNEQISDLTPLCRYYNRALLRNTGTTVPTSNNTSNSAVSFRVRPGCNLKLSKEEFLKEDVNQFTNASQAMTLFVPKSALCECTKECKCEDNRLRRSECARAYINTDCTNCKAQFTTMKTGESWKTFPAIWSGRIKSLILRPGCSVSLRYTHSGSRTQVLSSSSPRIVHDPAKVSNLAQYSCTCTQNLPNRSKPKPSPNDPPMIDIPISKGRIINSMASPAMKNHPGLIAALQSLRNKKCSKDAYILVLGMTGSGKSSAVNLLFDHPNVTKVGDYVSTTKDILEFTIPVPVPELGMKNSALHVIDTPGIEDTEGLAQDARFLATLEKFLSKHEHLKRNLPNVVLIFSKFSDNRFLGQGSSFVRMLRTIDLFKERIIDKQSTNVIFVLTHYMSETRDVTRDPTKRIQSFRQTIQDFSTLPRPIHIVLAENKPEDCKPPLLSINGFWQLPNGELYPKNLFNQMQRVLRGDPVGEAVIRNAFANSDNFQISSKAHPILAQSNTNAIRYLGVLAAFNTPVNDTEVSAELNKSFNQIDPTLKAKYPEALPTLQRRLHMQHLFLKSDLPRSSTGILKLLQTIPRNPATLFLLENAFNMTVPEFKGNLLVGSGYSLILDKVLPSKIFRAEITSNRPSNLLFRIPDMYKVQFASRLDTQLQIFKTKQDYVQGRMASLKLSKDVIPFEACNSFPSDHPGFNLIATPIKNNASSGTPPNPHQVSLTAAVNCKTFQIGLNESRAKFTSEFETALAQLDGLDMSNSSNVENWQAFFERYGTHVVTQAYGGGSIQVKVTVDSNSPPRQLAAPGGENLNLFIKAMTGITQGLTDELMGKYVKYSPPPGVSYQFVQLGGDRKHHWSNFSELDTEKDIDKWTHSIQYEPAVLTSDLSLLPISEIVKRFGGNGKNQGVLIEEAAAALFNASLLFVPVKNLGGGENELESRDKVSISVSIPSGDLESMKDFADMFKAMSEANNNLQKQILQWMAESEKGRARQEQKWEEERRLQKLEQMKEDEKRRADLKEDREWALKQREIDAARLAQENVQRLKMEAIRQKAEMEHNLKMEQIRVNSEKTMLAFINSENERRTKLAMSQPRKQGGGFSLALDFSNLLGGKRD